MVQRTSAVHRQPDYRWASLSLFVTVAIILGALAFEHIGGYKACPLCLQQRYAYYIAIPALFVALILLSADKRRFAAALFFCVSMLFLANSLFGVYHAGAEWGFWDVPTTCANVGEALTGGAKNLLSSLKNVDIVDCGNPELIILGLSLAGWNAIISLCLAIGCLKAALFASKDAI